MPQVAPPSLQSHDSCASAVVPQNTQTPKSKDLVTTRGRGCLVTDPEGIFCTSFDKNKAESTSSTPALAGTNGRCKDLIIVAGYVFAIVVAGAILAFVALVAAVHNTYPGTLSRYQTGGPILFANATLAECDEPIYPCEVTTFPQLNPNGTISWVESTSSYLSGYLLRAVKLGPTILPIVFAAIASSFLRFFARWKAQRGARIDTLELLIGSRSLGNTLTNLVSFPTLGGTGTGLLLLWILSPLAGQAALRVIEVGAVTDVKIPSPWYVSNMTDHPTYAGTETCVLADSDIVSVDLMTEYAEAIWSGAKTIRVDPRGPQPRDQKGNPLLPLPGIDLGYLQEGYSNSKQQLDASSFSGVQILGSALDGFPYGPTSDYSSHVAISTANISFPFTIFNFNCTKNDVYPTNASWTTMLGPDSIYQNQSDSFTGSSFFIDTYTKIDIKLQKLQTIIFGSFLPGTVTLRTCEVGFNTRNIDMDCTEDHGQTNCQWQAIGDSVQTFLTPLNNNTISARVYSVWPQIDKGSSYSASFTERYLADGSTIDLSARLVDLSTVDNITFSARLTTVFNTFWTLSRQMNYDVYNNACMAELIQTTASTPLTLLPIPIIVCNWAWFSILTVTSILLLSCAIMNLWFHLQINTPDILGYVSSMAIDNPHLPIPGQHPGARSALDGLERAKYLGDIKVKIGDVQSGEKMGKIAFAAEGNGVVTYERGRRVI